MRKLAVGLVLGLVVALGGVAIIASWLPDLNPFREEQVDRTGPPVLESLTDLSEYRAASAHYETVVDIEKDAEWLPDLVAGERVLYVGKGDVDVFVDFSGLDASAVTVSPDRTSVTVRLPAPQIAEPVLDLDQSYVVMHDQGLVNRFRGSAIEREAQLEAVRQMGVAAAGESRLGEMAEANTTAMLRGLLGALGYTSVTVVFDAPLG